MSAAARPGMRRMLISRFARSTLVQATALITLAAPAAAGPLRTAASTQQVFGGPARDLYTLAVRATVWGYPLVRAAKLREKATQSEDPFASRALTVATAPLNRLGRARQLADPETRIGVAPNNDTLYVLAFLDMRTGPFLLRTPDFGSRYYIFQFGEADSSTRHSYGQSTHGRKLPSIFITSPDYRGATPAGALTVRSEQRYLMVAGRILVTGSNDLPAVHQLQDRISLDKWLGPGRLVPTDVMPQRRLADPDSVVPDRLKLLADLGTVLQDWEPTPWEERLLQSFRPIGLTPGGAFQADRLSSSEQAAVAAGIDDGLEIIRAKTRNFGAMANGWSTSYAGSTFGQDYLLRAAVAMDQIYVVDKNEALYPVAHLDGRGAPLDGRNRYVICFPKRDLPPVKAFWSITLYYAKGFLVPNSLRRYSIGDRTPGLTYGKDGSLKLYVQNESPGPERVANWLPAPKEGFMLMMRLYRPKPSVIDGAWHPPAIMPVGSEAGAPEASCSAP